MAIMTRYDFAKQIVESDLNTVFGMEYDNYALEYPQYMDVSDVSGRRRAFEEDVLQAGLGYASEKAEGAAFAEDAGKEAWTKRYTHRTIGMSFLLSMEAIEDNQYLDLGPKFAKSMAVGIRQTCEVYSANVINDGFDAAHPGGDGQPLFSAAHPTTHAGDQTNLVTAADFGETSLEEALTICRKMKNDRGIPIMAKGKRVCGPPELMWDMRKVLQTPNAPFSADNTKNVVRDAISTEALVITNLTNPKAWFVKTDVEYGLRVFDRIATVIPKATVDDSTGNVRYRGRCRRSEGFSDWRGAIGSAGA